jgi:hypothetical protein
MSESMESMESIESNKSNESNESNEQKINTEKMSLLCDNIMRILTLIRQNKETYKTNKNEMLRIVKFDNLTFYDKYTRICRALVYEDDISPLIAMIRTFGQVQSGTMSFNKANDLITNALNAQYVDPILNNPELVKEREEKQKQEKIVEI